MLMPIIHPGETIPTLEFLQVAEDETDATSYSFTSQNFGAADPERELIALVFWVGNAASRTLDSATIGGVTADIRIQIADATPANPKSVAIIQAAVPTGTSGTVALTFSGSCLRAAIGLYRVRGLSSRTPTHTGSDTDDTLGFGAITVNKGGFVIAGGHFNAVGDVVFADNQIPNLIAEDFDQQFLAAIQQICGGSAQDMAAFAANYSANMDGPAGDAAGVLATWR